MTDNLKPFFCFFGGKGTKAKELISYFPKHDIFIEPFLGSGAIFLSKTKAKTNILNDLHPLIYNIWINTQKLGNIFDTNNDNDKYDFTPYREKWKSFRKDFNKGSDDEKLYKGLYVIYNAFNSRILAGISLKRRKKHLQRKYKTKLNVYKEKLKDV